MNLTEDITLESLIKSQTAQRLKILNVPDKEQIENMKYLALKILQPLREYYGFEWFINSGLRCKALNDAKGSTDASFHLHGGAADIDSEKIPLIDILCYIYQTLPFTELIAENFPGGWVHVAIIKGRENEKKLKLKDEKHNYSIVSLEYILDIYGKAA